MPQPDQTLPPLSALEDRCARHLGSLGGDVAHDVEHTRRVVANAKHLAAVEGARLEIVVPAAWLHDCVVVPKTSADRSRASTMAAAEATGLLAGWGYDAELLPGIAHAVEAHSFSAGVQPRTIEAGVLQDADRLDALGAVGLARCLMLGATFGCQHHDDRHEPLIPLASRDCRNQPRDDEPAVECKICGPGNLPPTIRSLVTL